MSDGGDFERDGYRGPWSGAQLILLWLLSFGLSLGAGYPAVFRYDPARTGAGADAADYFAMVRGQRSEAAVHRQGRVLLPAVARLLVPGMKALGLGERSTAAALLMVNAALVAATACVVFLMGVEAGLEAAAALAALLLWLSSFAVVQFQLAGGVDSAEALAVAAVLLAGVLRRWSVWPLMVGILAAAKETAVPLAMAAIAVFVVLERWEKRPSRRVAGWALMALASGVLVAMAVRGSAAGNAAWPASLTIRPPSLVELLAELGRALWNRGNLYVFALLVPFGLPGIRKLPARFVVPSFAAAGTALFLATLIDSGSNTARPLFSALGPLLAIGAVRTLRMDVSFRVP